MRTGAFPGMALIGRESIAAACLFAVSMVAAPQLAGQSPQASSEQRVQSSGRVFQLAHEQEDEAYADPAGFDLEANAFKVNLTAKWLLTIDDGANHILRTLPHNKSEFVQKVTYAPVPGGVILCLEYGDVEGTRGMAMRIALPSGKLIWKAEAPLANILGMLQDDNLFLAGVGVVGCIDPKTGALRWKHAGLYDNKRGDFLWVEAIRVEGDRVTFVSGRPKNQNIQPQQANQTVQIELSTGKMIRTSN
jgi:hypothetical protein